MKVIVGVKRVIDAYVKVRVRADGGGVETDNVKMSMNPFCEIAVEEAVKLKESGAASELVAVSCGPKENQETLRTALAVGCDKAILAEHDSPLEPLAVAKILRVLVEREEAELVLLGKQSVDNDYGNTGQMLAGMLGWSQGSFVSRIEIADGALRVAREVDDGLEKLRLSLPAVLSADLRLNVPRYASLPNIMKARSKPMETLAASDLVAADDLKPRLEVLEVTEPPPRAAGVKVESVSALVENLKEAKVL
ncbi:MAG: electron transfer flavoprotein subunit beta/FixA family protein [Alphaproteobacteria bacterium]|nr:electron transfer flavoprotein subunit beta/FixA family protein [Alphaproteobacteria bacterium]MDA8004749.1 electron transfer flavoprotein subunit beta/FixA family protein [Alphaproteobacteria bacterium]MDA8006275.1 electron transfer flavoprotein subunit beta/FixA family protein [Alphaproteobacteria bacterium]MDA8013502.1 electron transfer flavoprotein subunit beta/FixA family protein [Alphaproteobacteria bacterium]